jgi:ABC-type iron transport system FetAB ATPase subunit
MIYDDSGQVAFVLITHMKNRQMRIDDRHVRIAIYYTVYYTC